MEDFVAELGGVPVRMRCRFSENRDFLKDYLTDKQPLFTVEPGDADLIQMQLNFERMDAAEGIPPHRRTEEFLENNAIHFLLAERMVEHNVLLMHGSALCMDGEGIIFTAKSGTGKSTHARLWRDLFGERVRKLNDDKPLLRIEDHGVTVYGTPWDGKHHLNRNTFVRLKAIVKLNRDKNEPYFSNEQSRCFPGADEAVLCLAGACHHDADNRFGETSAKFG